MNYCRSWLGIEFLPIIIELANKMAADHSTILPVANNLLIGLAGKEQYYMEKKILDGQLPL